MSQREGEVTNFEGCFIDHKFAKYIDNKGGRKTWEFASIKNGKKTVTIIAKLVHSNQYVLIKRFRPAVGTDVIEFPSGLIKETESPVDTAMRKLWEETGYTACYGMTSKLVTSAAGVTDEESVFVDAIINDKDKANIFPEQNLIDPGEEIQTILVEEHKLYDYLMTANHNGQKIDSRLMAFAFGISEKFRFRNLLKDLFMAFKSLF